MEPSVPGSCFVDFEDFALFASHWLESLCNGSNNNCSGADLDMSGVVNVGDLEIFVNAWLNPCPDGWGL